MKIEHLPGVKLAPEVVLHRTLEKDDLIAVAIVMQRRDGAVQVDWSTMTISTMCMMATALDIMTRREMEEAYDPSPADKH